MADFRGYVTAAGQTFEALAKQMGYPVTIGFIEVGDGKLPDSESPIDRTQLVHKLKQFPAIVEQDTKNPGQWVATCYIPADDAIDGAGYFIREIGCKLINQGAGVLYAYRRVSDDWKPVITSGEAKSFIYKLRFIPSNGELLTPTIDPSVVLVDKEELARVMKAHVESTDHPYATEAEKGFVRLATQNEVDKKATGESGKHAITIETLWGWAESSAGNINSIFSIWKRLLDEAGFSLIGMFGRPNIIESQSQSLLSADGTKAYVWTGQLPKDVSENEVPEEGAGKWRLISGECLRTALSSPSGHSMLGIGGGRTQADKNAETVSVTDHPYNVVFDNVTDNTERLTAAFTSGKRVIVPDPGKGNYAMISDTVKVGNGTIVIGPGRDKLVIKAMPSMDGAKDCIATSVYKGPQLAYDDYVHVLGLGIHANGLNRTKAGEGEWGRGIRFGAARRSSIQGCKIVQPLQHGVDITNYDDDDIAIGHSGIPVGMSSDIFVYDVVVVDPLYDDGITTHYCHDVSVKRCTTIITDETKAVHEFQVNSKGIEVDDGSYDILVEDCNSYCNNTKVTAFSVSTHANAPAAYNIKFKNCRAYGTRCLINAWSDKNTDAHHGTSDWKSRNIVFEGISGEKGWFDKDNPIFPNRIVEVSGFVDVKVNDITFSVSGKDGSYDAPVSVINLADAIDVKMRDIKITGVPHIPVVEPTAARTVGWIRVSGNSSNIELDGFKINALGWFNRIISDSASNAFTSVKNVTVNDSPLDGQEKIAIVSGSNKLKTRNIKVPAGVLPYAIGSSFKNYADGDYNLNQTVNDVTVGGYRIESHTLPDGSQAKSGLMFDNQFSSPDLMAGKGNISYRTSDDKQTSFTICAYHNDRNTYVPILRLQDTTGARSIEAGIDDTTYLGRNASRFKTGYFSSNIIVTSDEREKTRPFEIEDKALDAWGSVNIIIFQWIDSVITKGDDVARWHYGVIAQQVRDAFARFGIDGTRYGLLCYDEWKDEYKPIYETIELEDGSFAQVDTGKKIQTQIAGNRWGIRPDQCFWIEAAYQRRENKLIRAEISEIKSMLAGITK